MKIHIATIIEKMSDGEMYFTTFCATTYQALAKKVEDSLSREEKDRDISIVRSTPEILLACEKGNQYKRPYTMPNEQDRDNEFYLSTTIEEI